MELARQDLPVVASWLFREPFLQRPPLHTIRLAGSPFVKKIRPQSRNPHLATRIQHLPLPPHDVLDRGG